MPSKKVMKDSKHGKYYTIPFSKSRDIVVDFISLGDKTLKVYAIGEVDVTLPLKKIAEYKEKGIKLSFTAYISYVFVQTILDHPFMQAIKWKRRKMVIFEDVDLMSIVEKEVKGKKVPTQLIIRKANEKSIQEITTVLWSGREKKDDSMVDKEKESGTDLLLRLPGFFRRFLMNRIFNNPFLRRQFLGTVGVTSIGMYTKGGGTSIPIAVENISINVGGIDKKPGYPINKDGSLDLNKIEPRDYLWLTFNIDHTTVDGAPTARFIADFRERLSNAYGLDDLDK
jgi:pyruvate/2-oxoglutarate dehydrogenase complex dihydrolipoamide acyltransferase (E2) component